MNFKVNQFKTYLMNETHNINAYRIFSYMLWEVGFIGTYPSFSSIRLEFRLCETEFLPPVELLTAELEVPQPANKYST